MDDTFAPSSTLRKCLHGRSHQRLAQPGRIALRQWAVDGRYGEGSALLPRILNSRHDLHVLCAVRTGANIDLERAGEKFGPPVIFDFLAVGTTIGVEASKFSGHDLVPLLAVGGENAGICRQMTVWWKRQRSDFFAKLFRG